MATYKVTDPNTGRTLRLTGDSPPTENELNEIFSSQKQKNPYVSALQEVGKGMMLGMPKVGEPIEPAYQINKLVQAGGSAIGSQVRQATGIPTNFATELLTNPTTYSTMFAGRGVPKVMGEGIERAMSKSPSIDKPMMDRANILFNSSDDALKNVQGEIATFRDATKNTPIKLDKVNEIFKKLGKKGEKLEEEILYPEGFIDDLSSVIDDEPNLGTIYKAKDTISKHIKDQSWVKYKMGEEIAPDQEKLIKTYFGLDKHIDDVLSETGQAEERKMLDYLNQKATDVYKLTRQAKKLVTAQGGVTRDPSKLIEAFTNIEKGIGKRNALQQLAEIEPRISEVIAGMNKYRTTKTIKKMLERTGIIGGEMGVLGTGIGLASKVLRR